MKENGQSAANTNVAVNSDILIIGAGPVGLFAVFEAGLLKLRCHVVDALPMVGGQLAEIYPKKPIYDIPGFPSILAGDLVNNLMEQISPFHPGFTLGERAEKLEKSTNGKFVVTTNKGTILNASVVVIAGGLGSFEPRKPPIPDIDTFEDCGLEYFVKNPEMYKGKRVTIAGGGDSALDWSIYLAEVAAEVTLVHRRNSFRGALDSVEKLMKLANAGKVNLITDAQVVAIQGNHHVESIHIKGNDGQEYQHFTDHFIPLFGLAPKLGPIGDWGLQLDKNAVVVNTQDYSTNIPGVYAIGDINTYKGKLKLILCGFHEATLMSQSAFQYIYPEKKLSFKYTTVTGVTELN